MPRLVLLAALALAASGPLADSAAAQTCTTEWLNPVDGDFLADANWTNGAPNAASTACITVAGTYTVTLNVYNEAIGPLILGGDTGTQTLRIGRLGTLQSGHIRENGRMEVLGGNLCFPGCPGAAGLYRIEGTLLVEGVLTLNADTGLASLGGTIDIAPGGTFLMDPTGNGASVGQPNTSLFRLRGRLVHDSPTDSGLVSRVVGNVVVEGGTVYVEDGSLGIGDAVDASIELRDATFNVAEGASFGFGGNRATILMEGTVGGDVQGSLGIGAGRLQAGPADATLDFRGNGLTLSRFTVPLGFESLGGEFLNTGVLQANTFVYFSQLVFRNEGTLRLVGSIGLYNGAVIRNEVSGTLDVVDEAGVLNTGVDGRVENVGLLLSRAENRPGSSQIFNGTLRNRPGSEVRLQSGINFRFDPPASALLPAGVRLTGDGLAAFLFGGFDIEGIVSPGTDATPIDTLYLGGLVQFSPDAGSPQVVIDVDAGGVSDLVQHQTFVNVGLRLAGATLVVRLRPGYTPQVGDTFTILQTNLHPLVPAHGINDTFRRIVVDGAADGIAFVTETSADRTTMTLRAVEAAPGGEIQVSETEPVGGGLRRMFLSGPGAVGVSAARLECIECLDADAFGTIEAEILDVGNAKDLVFDLTSPRAFGSYDLVLTQPGLDDVRTPVTVRPYLAYVFSDQGSNLGASVRPAGFNYNYSTLQMEVRTNADAPAFHVPRVERSTDLYDLALASGNAFFGGRVFYESATSSQPNRAPLVVGRLREGRTTPLTVGLRIEPDDVLFPDQTPTGPDDPRIPFGDPTQYATAEGLHHLSTDRTVVLFEEAMRTSGNAALADYIAALDAADPLALKLAIQNVLRFQGFYYYTPPDEVVDLIVQSTSTTVSAPPDLSTNVAGEVEAVLQILLDEYAVEITAALTEATTTAPTTVGTLLDDEITVLFPEGLPGTSPDDGFCLGVGSFSIEAILARLSGVGGGGGCPMPPNPPYDPNDKIADIGLTCETGTVDVGGEDVTRCVRYYVPLAEATEPLQYTVTFENVAEATASAEFVTITDVLDPSLNPATLEVLATSSDSTFSHTVSGQTVTFRFVGIDLPPNVNAPEGEGFVTFAVRPHGGLATGTEITNGADIVFDFNPPIVTPEVVHEIRATADLATTVEAPDFVEVDQPVPFQVVVANLRGDAATAASVTIQTGTGVLSATPSLGSCSDSGPVTCSLGDLAAGETVTIDLVLTGAAQGEHTFTSVVATSAFDGFAANDTDAVTFGVTPVGVEDDSDFPREVTLSNARPNPARGATTLRWGVPLATRASLRVYDLRGREIAVLLDAEAAAPGWHETRWTADVASGVYVVRLDAGDVVQTRKLLVIR